MVNKPTQWDLRKIPKLQGTNKEFLADRIVHMRFSIGDHEWYAIECDGDDICWGFVILNDDITKGRFGHFSIGDLATYRYEYDRVVRDLEWKPTKIAYVERIQESLWHHMPARKQLPQENCENT